MQNQLRNIRSVNLNFALANLTRSNHHLAGATADDRKIYYMSKIDKDEPVRENFPFFKFLLILAHSF